MKQTFLLSLTIVFLWGLGAEAKGVTVEGFRNWSSKEYTRVVIDLDGAVNFTQNRLSNPDRLYFDLMHCRLSKKASIAIPVNDGILKDIRAGQFNSETVRIVLDLHAVESFNVFMLESPYRLVVDVFGVKNAQRAPAKDENEKFNMIKKVVIDPGHGGEDPGAVGPGGLFEKDVVLAIAKRLGRILKEKYKMEVIFTRDRDVYIPLEERTAIANSKGADLFVSIHVNASRQRSVRGIETYFLNWTTNDESNRVAARENAISYEKMKELQKGDFVQMILQDKARDYKSDESRNLAGGIQTSLIHDLKKDYDAIEDLGVKWALFYVLVGAEMPSVLIETSFISNRREEKRLATNTYKQKIAEAIAGGIHGYFESKKQIVKRIPRDKI